MKGIWVGLAVAVAVAASVGAATRAAAGSGEACSRIARPSAGGSTVWVSRYNGPGNSSDAAQAIAASPDGSKVFVTGSAIASSLDYGTVAYDASTGAQLWDRLYDGGLSGTDWARAIAVSPDSRVFVTGESTGTKGRDFATVAYDASSGDQLWVQRYNGYRTGFDSAAAVTISRDGARVFVTGKSFGGTSGYDYATVAYDAASGAELWVARYDGPANGVDSANALALSRDGSTVFVTGSSRGTTSGADYATIAYDAATGAERWIARYNAPANGDDGAGALAVGHDGRSVYVTGGSVGADQDYATVAYDAVTGAERWAARYATAQTDIASAIAVGITPTSHGGVVFVTGQSGIPPHDTDFATVAYDAATGAQRWVQRYSSGCIPSGVANALGVTKDGSKVFVAGSSPNWYAYATVAYDARSGSQLWDQHYVGPGHQSDDNVANALAIGPDQSKVFVTGYSDGGSSFDDFATVAYTTG